MTTASSVQVPAVTSVQALIDNVAVTTTAGSVQRQVVTLADSTSNNYVAIGSDGKIPTKEALGITETDASQTVGNSAVTAINAGVATTWVNIQNVSTNGNLLGYTFDGSTPVISAGVPGAGTFILLPYGSVQYSGRIPSAALKIIGSAAATVATIKYA